MQNNNYTQEMFADYPDVVDANQLSDMLGGIGIRTVYKLLRTGKIKSFIKII